MTSLYDYRPSLLILPTAPPLSPDERVWSLYEGDVMHFDGKGLRRQQTIRVFRGGNLVEFSIDLGIASDWTCGPIAIVSLLEDTVGQVREMVDTIREDNGLELAMQAHRESGPNVIERSVTSAEQVQEWMRRNGRTSRNLHLQQNRDVK